MPAGNFFNMQFVFEKNIGVYLHSFLNTPTYNTYCNE